MYAEETKVERCLASSRAANLAIDYRSGAEQAEATRRVPKNA